MGGLTGVEGVSEFFAIALPLGAFLVLAALLFVVITRRRYRARKAADDTADERLTRAASGAADIGPSQRATDVASMSDAAPPPVSTVAQLVDIAIPEKPSSDAVAPVHDVTVRLAELDAAVADALLRNADDRAAILQLERAACWHELGDARERAAALRAAIAVAQPAGDMKTCATARLGLADIAREEGDLTSACEHWQMARVALLESGQQVEHDRIDALMRANGCPTDWVLTDF